MATLSPPSTFNVQQGNGNVALSWSLVSGATGYQIQRSTDGVTFTNLATATVPVYLDTTVTVGSIYYYQVATINGSGTGSYTAPLTAVPTVAGEISLGEIRLLCQQRADRVNSNFITTSEWNWYITQSYFELYDLLVTAYEDYYLGSPLIITTDGNWQYALPNGQNYLGNTYPDTAGQPPAPPYYKLMGVDCGLDQSDNAWVTLNRFNFIDRNRFVFPNIGSTFLGVFNLQYRVMGNSIYFIPTPAAAQVLRLWYIPRLVQPIQDTDILDGVSGWTEYVIIDAAIKALQKEEQEVQELMAQKQAIIDRIQGASQGRDAGESASISDTRANIRWGQGNSPNGNGGFAGW